MCYLYITLVYINVGPTCMGLTPNVSWCTLDVQESLAYMYWEMIFRGEKAVSENRQLPRRLAVMKKQPVGDYTSFIFYFFGLFLLVSYRLHRSSIIQKQLVDFTLSTTKIQI
jgi:hypothetical protein